MNNGARINIGAVKTAAAGRWPEILSALGGIDRAILDGKHHPCPRCGGTDRFRVIDPTAGALFCNQCFSSGNGDGLAAVRWLRECDFPTALRLVSEHLGVNGSANGPAGGNGKPHAVYPTAAAAIAELERRHGQSAARWTYHNSGGAPVGVIVRWDRPDGAKDIRPVSAVEHGEREGENRDGGWTIGGMPEPRPLYHLPALLGATRVYVCEGEKAAEAACSIGLVATTSPHGSRSARRADWSPLAGKDVVVLPDNDRPGREYADTVAGILRALDPPAKVRVVELPGLPPAGDIADWLDERDAIDPDELRAQVEALADAAPAAAPSDTPRFVSSLMTSAALAVLDRKPRWLVKNVVSAGEPLVIGGRSKTLKTSVTVDLILSLGSGTPFLGRFEADKINAAFFSGESGIPTLRRTALRVAASKGIDLADSSVLWGFDLPRLSRADHLDALGAVIREHRLQFVAVDPLYLSLLDLSTAGAANNLFAMGAALGPLSELGQATGCTVCVLHHFRKNSQATEDDPAGLAELAQSGIGEWARQWVLLQRRSAYQSDGRHELFMRTGGSAGHAGLWAVDIDEGTLDPETFSSRTWDAEVKPIGDARAEAQRAVEQRKAEAQERKEDEWRGRLRQALRAYPNGETGRVLREAAGLSGTAFGLAVRTLIQRGECVPCTVQKCDTQYEGYVYRNPWGGTGGTGWDRPGTVQPGMGGTGQGAIPVGDSPSVPPPPTTAPIGLAEIDDCPSDN